MQARVLIPLSLFLTTGDSLAGALREDPEPSPPTPAAAPQNPANPTQPKVSLASRDDVASRLGEQQGPRSGLMEFGPVSLFDRFWKDANARLEEALGMRFGLSYKLTFQAATSGPGDRSGAEGDLDLIGAWRLLGKQGETDIGTLNVNAQHIHTFGETAPANLSPDIGAIWGTSDGTGYDESFPVTQLYYEQRLLDDHLMLIIGKIDTSNYVGTNRFADDSLYFMNRAFSSNPAMNLPGNGLGAVLAGRITEQVYVGGCIADANGDETQTGFTSIDAGEFFVAGEVGLTLELEGLGHGRYRFTGWHSDRASEVDLPEDYGFALSIDQELGNGVVPFFRYAWSEGDATGVPNIVAGGVGFEGLFGRKDDVLGLGLSWGESTDNALDDQVASEAFYRLQLSTSIQCTIGAQVIFNALDSDSGDNDVVGVFEARLRVTF